MAQTPVKDDPFALVGRRIVEVRAMTKREIEAEGWYGEEPVPVLVLDNGVAIFPSRDPEGNGPGAFFGKTSKAQGFRVLAPKRT